MKLPARRKSITKLNTQLRLFKAGRIPASRSGQNYFVVLGKVMVKNKNTYGKLITEEMGKPIRQSIAEIDKCRWASNYYSDHAEAFLSDKIVPTEFYKSFVLFEPLGIVAAIMPWNFPFWQVMRSQYQRWQLAIL